MDKILLEAFINRHIFPLREKSGPLSDRNSSNLAEVKKELPEQWYKEAVVYALYVDLFDRDLDGLRARLGYLENLGINCIWLLPILSSPGRDAGFDIDDFYAIRPDLLGNNAENRDPFRELITEAHLRGIRIIFDIALNHTSDRHPWFRQASSSRDNPYREYYIWSEDTAGYSQARIIFKGIESSNWEACGDAFYFHRFFHFQPDLNYRKPEVLLAMSEVLLFWQQQGIDGFRADAIPYLWKEEHTDCENLPATHLIMKFFRAVLDAVKPGTLLLAEACQPPHQVVAYFGRGDECHAAYHFPLMPRIFISLSRQNGDAIRQILSPAFTPEIPADNQWFTFLRCHDELSLEKVYVSETERAFLHGQYCRRPEWDFREGEGISARLAELLGMNTDSILLAFSLMLTLPGTPVIYYGDETGKGNDEAFYREMKAFTGKDDSRYLVRGRINWEQTEQALADPASQASRIFYPLQEMIRLRKQFTAFGRGSISFENTLTEEASPLLIYRRLYEQEGLLLIHNLGEKSISPGKQLIPPGSILFSHGYESGRFDAFGFIWIDISATNIKQA
ncbi:MAG TPA: alpha-amylase family glycosyl hydrolase [Bacteroidales bacterium]|nr:alpha-amylase family glycosyl hydrolase [Bacteroidales bacterium]HSA42542.1 alpha-amylase family glycosyl hydrolase [Bacteroidales bacterium]